MTLPTRAPAHAPSFRLVVAAEGGAPYCTAQLRATSGTLLCTLWLPSLEDAAVLAEDNGYDLIVRGP